MRSRWFLVPGMVAILSGAVSCGGDDERDDGPRTPYQQYAADYIDAFCTSLAPCCTFVPFSIGECKTWLGFVMMYEASAARADKYVFYQDRADQCLADIRAQGLCTGVEPASCAGVVEGKLAGGDSCKSSAECPGNERVAGECFENAS